MNGNGGDDQRLAALEQTIMGDAKAIHDINNLAKRLTLAADTVRELARRGETINQVSMAFSDHLEELLGEYTTRMRQTLSDLDSILGKME